MKRLWFEVEKLLGIYRWHPKIALRYLPVIDYIRKTFSRDISLLEVGSGGLGIAPYIKQRVVGIDLKFIPPVHELLVPVIGSALNLPFANKSFDTVISLDMLEHIDPQNRFQAVSEIIRVAKSLVCIGFPCGNAAEEQDKELLNIYTSYKKSTYEFLEEHVTYGLPLMEQVKNYIKNSASNYVRFIEIEVIGNLNIHLRKVLMQGWMTQNLWVSFFFRKVCLLLIPFFRRMNSEPTYRKLIFIKFYD